MSISSPRPVLRALVLATLASNLWSGCGGLGTYATPCYDDSACENGTVCRSGECVLQCLTDDECPAGAPLCQYNRCIAPATVDGAAAPDALPLIDLSPLPDAAVVSPDAAVATPDAAVVTPDAAVVTPDAAVVSPDAAVVTPDAAVITPDAAVATPDAAVATPDAAAPDAAAVP